jgi:hypothetical protein
MWQALSARQLLQARGTALFIVLLLPWLFLTILVSVVNIYGAWFGGGRQIEFSEVLAAWFLFGLGVNIISACWARQWLYRSFRVAATERFQARRANRSRWAFWRGG